METHSGVESSTINFIPENQRHGKVRDQATFWFGTCIAVVNMPLGVLAIELGLNLLWAIVAIVIGTILGTVFAGLHALQGPRLGVPQMIQSRAQFGYYGASFLFLATFLLCVGFAAAELVLQAESLQTLVSAIPIPAGVLIFTVPVLILSIFGYDLLHTYVKWASVILGLGLVVLTIQLSLYHGHLAAGMASTALPGIGSFLAVVALFAVNTLTWAPYVSDYSRYLPKNVRFWPSFGAISTGMNVATIWTSIIGAVIGALLPKVADASVPEAVRQIAGPWVLILLGISLIPAVTTCAYSSMLSLVTLVSHRTVARPSIQTRIIGIAIFTVVTVAAADLGYNSFLNNFEDFLDVLLFIFVPWTAINLVDFYGLNHDSYDVRELFTPSGIFGRWRWQGLVAYVVGLGIQMPFISQTLYTGPFVKYLDGADISWIVGLVVSATLYYVLDRNSRSGTEAVTPAEMPAAVDGTPTAATS